MPKNELKHPNVFKVSYPKATYLKAYAHANRTGMSIQDIQRRAMDEYLNRSEAAEAQKQAAKALKQEKPIQGTNPYFASFKPPSIEAVDMFGRTPEEVVSGIIKPRKLKP
jgi:hypothetical protein